MRRPASTPLETTPAGLNTVVDARKRFLPVCSPALEHLLSLLLLPLVLTSSCSSCPSPAALFAFPPSKRGKQKKCPTVRQLLTSDSSGATTPRVPFAGYFANGRSRRFLEETKNADLENTKGRVVKTYRTLTQFGERLRIRNGTDGT